MIGILLIHYTRACSLYQD